VFSINPKDYDELHLVFIGFVVCCFSNRDINTDDFLISGLSNKVKILISYLGKFAVESELSHFG
jgi:hypothetical protein